MTADSLVTQQESFKKLVHLVDKLRDIGLNEHISMPWIAVLGSQSSGKSSLLESIVGLNFLPRGSGVVTRRPLELRLQKLPDKADSKPYGKFLGDQKTYYDFKEIRTRIEQLTNEVCGTQSGIVDNPIVLQVYDRNIVDLTLIDLPGITRIPVGNQPKDIERITKEMVTRYCKDERTIILCVIPANADMSTQESLQLAQQLDPQGIRTIGVITKIDIMDKGTDARKMILNKEIPLRLGYIGVKGRTQEDINNNLTVENALEEERSFFQNHNAYWHLSKDLLGTQSLTKKLTSVMYDHIRNVLPSIIQEINAKIKSCENNISLLGEPIPLDNKKKLEKIWNEVSIFIEQFKNNVKGEFGDFYQIGKTQEQDQILASAQISILFNDLFKEYLGNYSASQIYSDKEMSKIINMYMGTTMPGFISVDCFMALTSPLMEKLWNPVDELLENVYMIIKNTGFYYLGDIFQSKENVKEALSDLFISLLDQSRTNCQYLLTNFIDCQVRVIFTKDPQYIMNAYTWPEEDNWISSNKQQDVSSTGKIQKKFQGIVQAGQSMFRRNEQEKQDEENENNNKQNETVKLDKNQRQSFLIKEMKKRVDKYFEISINQISDFVPKLITNFLINDIIVNQQGQGVFEHVQGGLKGGVAWPNQRAWICGQTKRELAEHIESLIRIKEGFIKRLKRSTKYLGISLF